MGMKIELLDSVIVDTLAMGTQHNLVFTDSFLAAYVRFCQFHKQASALSVLKSGVTRV